MIARTPCAVEEPSLEKPQAGEHSALSWQEELARAIRDPGQLLAELELPTNLLEAAEKATGDFPLRVPYPYLARIERGNLKDPLLRQVLPLAEELELSPGYVTDPLDEASATKTPGILHKYQGRALLIASGACAINCRYCFRRHFPYQDNNLSSEQWSRTLDYVRQDSSIDEVILSGGDPLAVSDKRLAWLLNEIEAIPHVQRLRIHTRLPVVIPARVTPTLLSLLQESRLNKVVVLHVNHPQELDEEVAKTVASLRSTGTTLLNQAVLLRGVNDDPTTLESLSKQLFNLGVLPYYLHLLDPVQGAAHFNVTDAEGVRFIRELTKRLPGYLVPKLVREEAGEASKTAILSLADDPFGNNR